MRPRPEIPGGPYLVVGLARSGAAAALALRARGEEVVGLDAESPAGSEALRRAGVQLHLDDDDGVALLENVRAVVKSPGVPAEARPIAAARERGLPVLGELELAWRLLTNEFIAVTGTNGKTTTVELIGHIHREAGLPVAVAGNVGTAASSLAGALSADATVACETSSFQLEDTLQFAPEAAVLLNLSADHLDRHGTMPAYVEAKLEIFARQGERDVAVLPCELVQEGANAGELRPAIAAGATIGGRARVICFGVQPAAGLSRDAEHLTWEGHPLLRLEELRLPGRHNLENAMAAAAVCLARGIDPQAVRAGLRSFAGIPHRLEEVGRRGGVLCVNDSKATNIASTLVALAAFPRRPIHLILGGQGKGQDFTALRGGVEHSCRAVYLIGEDTPAIDAALAGVTTPVLECGDLERALPAARRAASAGEVILLSPACASFDQFENFESRGERFRALLGQMEA